MVPILTYDQRLRPGLGWTTINNDAKQYLQVISWNWNPNSSLQSITAYLNWPSGNGYQQSFAYDSFNRLTQVNETLVSAPNSTVINGTGQRSFSYDPWGNMSVSSNGGFPTNGQTAALTQVDPGTNHLKNVNDDASGNQLDIPTICTYCLAYDAENHLVSANSASYSYDASGKRVMTTIGTTQTVFVYDAAGLLAAEYSSAAATAQPCYTCYLGSDHLGSTRLVTDENHQIVGRHDYLPFGEEITSGYAGRSAPFGNTDSVEQKFTGKIRDNNTGLDYFNARYYSSPLGRFTSPDPANAGADPSDPQTWNAYAYVRNNPLNAIDPTGKFLVDCSWDGCPSHGGGGGGGGAVIDGVEQTVFNTSGLGSNALAACPNNFCNAFAQAQDGSAQSVQYRASAGLGAQGYQTMQQMNTANYEVNGQFATAEQYRRYQAEVAAQHAYAAYLLDCQHSATPCSGGETVRTRYQGLAGNYSILGYALDPSSVNGMTPDPSITSNAMHGGPSWYDWNLVGTGHVATFGGNVESHFDTFKPDFPDAAALSIRCPSIVLRESETGCARPHVHVLSRWRLPLMKPAVRTLVLITACFTGAWDVPGAAAQTEVRIRFIDAHSGKPFVGREVELFGTNVASGFKARDTLFQLQSETQVDGVAHFRVTSPLPNRLLYYSAQANGCVPRGYGFLVTTEVLRSGVVVPDTCAGKRQKFNWREVTAHPGEIVIFVVEPRGP